MSSGTEETLAADTNPASSPRASSELMRLGRGERMGRYLVLDRIGAGGMGVVYSAYDPELDRKVAIKLLHPATDAQARPMHRAHDEAMHRLFGDSPPSPPGLAANPGQQRLLREAQATAQVSDPNVITVHDVGEHQGHVFIAMEFVHHERALAIQERALEPGHTDIALSLDELGEDHRARGEYDVALVSFRRALAILEAAAGGSPFESVTLFHIGATELDRGRPHAAVAPLERAVAEFTERGLDPDMRAKVQSTLERARSLLPPERD